MNATIVRTALVPSSKKGERGSHPHNLDDHHHDPGDRCDMISEEVDAGARG